MLEISRERESGIGNYEKERERKARMWNADREGANRGYYILCYTGYLQLLSVNDYRWSRPLIL